MGKLTPRPALRRIGTLLLVPVVLLVMAVEWASVQAFALFHFLIVFLRLKRLEDLLRRTPVWVSLPLFLLLCASWVPAKIYLLSLLLAGEYVKNVIFALLFKVFWFGGMNYLIRLFGEQYLAIPLVARLYEKYIAAKVYVTGLPWYRRIAGMKRALFARVRQSIDRFKARFRGGKLRKLLFIARSRSPNE